MNVIRRITSKILILIPETNIWTIVDIDIAVRHNDFIGISSGMGTRWDQQWHCLDIHKLVCDPLQHDDLGLLAAGL